MQTMASVSHCHESLSGHLACSMIVRDANPNRNYLPLPRDAGGFREYRRLDGANVFDLLAGPALMCSLMRTSGCVWPFAISMVWRIFRIRRRAIVLRYRGAHTPVSRVGIAGDRWNLKTDKSLQFLLSNLGLLQI